MTEYMKEYTDILKAQYKEHRCWHQQNNPENNKTAVIVEPRKHDLLIETINNVVGYLGVTWNVHVVTHEDNNNWLREHFPSINIINIESRSMNGSEYNKLFMSECFWNLFKEEHILIFQTDSCIMNSNVNIHNFLQHPFIGGKYVSYNIYKQSDSSDKIIIIPMNNSPSLSFSINGGFSLRQKSKMLECVRKITIDDIIAHRKKHNMCNTYYEQSVVIGEDTYFQNALDVLGYKFPTIQQCWDFCENVCESPVKINENSLGVHNTLKEKAMRANGQQVVERLRETLNLIHYPPGNNVSV
jgi:hypothetical protein